MTTPRQAFETDELLAQVGWVRALARAVAGDLQGAEDLAQDALVVALRTGGPSAAGGPSVEGDRVVQLRRWLAAVVRNLGRTERRRTSRRAERETKAAGSGNAPSTLALVERASVQRELVGALLELPEPYRTTLLLRFFEECSQREIAARTGVPISTVGTRIADGTARLRRRFHGRESWLSSVFVAPLTPQVTTPLLGAAMLSSHAKILLGGGLLVAAWFGFSALHAGAPAAPEAMLRRSATPQAMASSGAQANRDREPVPEALSDPVGSASRRFEEIPEHAGLAHVAERVFGRVIDLQGDPVGGVEIVAWRPGGRMFETGQPVAAVELTRVRADEVGSFELETRLPVVLRVADERLVTVMEGSVSRPGEAGTLIVVAQGWPVGGAIVEESGAPIADARITLEAQVVVTDPDANRARWVVPDAHSGPDGTFQLPAVGALDGANLRVEAAGFATRRLPLPAGGDLGMVVVLSKFTGGGLTIAGRVVLGNGAPAGGAWVSAGFRAVRADASGGFVIDCEPWREWMDEEAPQVVTALSIGLLPARAELPSLAQALTTGWTQDLVLRLGAEPLTIRGRVVDEFGAPIAGAWVEPTDMTPFGIVPADGLPGSLGIWRFSEQMAGGGGVSSGVDGGFELAGLADRGYSISALLRPSLLAATTESVRAGSEGVQVVLERALLGRLAGRIVDRDGVGIEGVRVAVSAERPEELVIGSSGITDVNGAFELGGVTLDPEFLRLEGDRIVPELFRELSEDDDRQALELRVERRSRIQVDWGVWPGVTDELVLVDATDRPLMMMRLQGGSIGEAPRLGYAQGLSEVLVVSDAAAFAVVQREGVEVRRLELDLDGAGIHRIEL